MHNTQIDPNEFFCHPLPPGDSIYSRDRPRVTAPKRTHGEAGGGGGGSEVEALGGVSGRVRRWRQNCIANVLLLHDRWCRFVWHFQAGAAHAC